MSPDVLDFLVRSSRTMSRDAYVAMSKSDLDSLRQELVAEVQAKLPPGYGEDHGDYAQFTYLNIPETNSFQVIYEVWL